MSKKILYLFDAGDWQSRMAVAHGARDKGMEVIIGLINGDEADADKAPEFKIIPLKKSGNSIGILSSLQMVKDINTLIKQEQPDIIHAVTLKYGFMSGIAAWSFKKIRKIHTLAGLGYLFRSDEPKSKLLQAALRPFLTCVLRRKNTLLIFQNPDDLDLMIRGRYALTENSVLIRGSGVYLDHFTPDPYLDNGDIPVVLMPTRLVHEKGVAIFIEAARILAQRGVKARFEIAGGETKHNPKAISRAEMEEMVKDGIVTWLGRVNDLPQRLAKADLIVYPSYYGEGIPRVLLESCAAGCAIITTDHPGCREAVTHGVNGLLVPVRDVDATAEAMHDLLSHSEKRADMAKHSRIKAEKEFDIHSIVAQTIALYEA